MFTQAIVRTPARSFAEGLTTADLGEPDYYTALLQHRAYCKALEDCGLQLTVLEPDPRYPDSVFVEDTAVLAGSRAILTRPGAPSREGEVAAIAGTLAAFFEDICQIEAPGTLDGGDICEADGHYFIGISARTNRAGAEQLAGFLKEKGFTSSFVEVTGIPGILHLKSGISYLGDDHLAAIEPFASLPDFQRFNLVRVSEEEAYAANSIRVNDTVLMPWGFPETQATLETLGFPVIALPMDEFRIMDGGLSCLSLRF